MALANRNVSVLRSRRAIGRASSAVVEGLESRTFLNATLTTAIPTVNVAPSAPSQNIDLNAHFTDPTVPGTAVLLDTPQGTITLALTDATTPKTVANFLDYINAGEYADTIVHRSVPGFVIQGGGYTPDGNHIPQFAPVTGEPGISNTTGTIAMALSGGADTGTSEWFINLANNTGLDQATNNNGSISGPFTVFGNVVYGGMTVVNQIAGLQIVDDSAQNGAWNTLPVHDFAGATTPTSVDPSNMETTSATVAPKLSYSVSSSNTDLVNPSLLGSSLTLAYGSGTGIANVTVTATDLGGNSTNTTFSVGVGVIQVQVGTGAAKQVKFTDPDGTASKVVLNGPGFATITMTGSGLTQTTTRSGVLTVSGVPQSVTIDGNGTTVRSALTITGSKSGNGTVDLAELSTNGSLRTLSARPVAMSGNVTVAGTVNTITLGSITGGSIVVSTGSLPVAITLAGAGSGNVSSAGVLKSLTAASWGGGTITASSITKVAVKGTFIPDISTTTLGSARLGSITGGTWNVSGAVTSVTAGSITTWTGNFGSIKNLTSKAAIISSNIIATANITTVAAGGLTNSNISAGSGLPPGTLPSQASDFVSASTISNVRIGKLGYVNSDIVASTLGHLTLGVVNIANGETSFGLGANVEIINVTAMLGAQKFKLKNATSQADVTAAVTAQGITPQDFVILIVPVATPL